MESKRIRVKKGTRKNRKNGLEGGGFWDFFKPKTALVQGQNTAGYNISYNGSPIKCEICSNSEFAHIDASITRSKIFNVVNGEDNEGLDQHPLTIYRCKTCYNCKVIYRVFGIPDDQRPIKEVRIGTQPPPPPPQAPTEQPK